jgi:hypothetical protein
LINTHIKLLKAVLRDLKDDLDRMDWSLGERMKTRFERSTAPGDGQGGQTVGAVSRAIGAKAA